MQHLNIFRNSLNNVLILTIDELYKRIVDLISVLIETPSQTQSNVDFDENNEKLPI